MRYWAYVDDVGITVRAAESREKLWRPRDWREVPNIWDHLNARGVEALDAGESITFTQEDQSYPLLEALFYQ